LQLESTEEDEEEEKNKFQHEELIGQTIDKHLRERPSVVHQSKHTHTQTGGEWSIDWSLLGIGRTNAILIFPG
jgi:hypothetical protein